MAKKTSYLTELIDRHERWRAEGGERDREDEAERDESRFVAYRILACLCRKLKYVCCSADEAEDGRLPLRVR